MKKEELIKKAAERGIDIDETAAEKLLHLSDEELANIAGGGCGDPPADTRVFGDDLSPSDLIVINDLDRAAASCEFASPLDGATVTNCTLCRTRLVIGKNGRVMDVCYNPRLVAKVRFSRVI
ncbi:MAG: hypothetical protein LBL80_05140 [Ruminococcus sp.]|jgi:hypothetical protein|nr:hypothetical protein [Ruminococcus sp.]